MTTVLFAAAGLPSFLYTRIQLAIALRSGTGAGTFLLIRSIDALFFKGRLFLPCHSVLIYFSLLFRYLIPIYIITNKSVILHYYNFKSVIIILYIYILYPRYDFY